MLYLESIGNPRRFLRIARHVAARKPIVMLKAGRSSAGRRGAASHTASLASDDATTGALLDASGVIRVDSLEELLDVAQVLDRQPPPPGPRLGLVGNAGGPLILAADTAERSGLTVPLLSDALQARIRARVPSAASTSNPVDLLATVGTDAVGEVVDMIAASGEVDAVVVGNVGLRPSDDAALGTALDGASSRAVPVVVSVAGIPTASREHAVFRYSESAVRALSHAHRWTRWQRSASNQPPADLTDIDWLAVRRLVRAEARALRSSTTETTGWLEPASAGRVMRAAGLRLVASTVVTDVDAMRAAAAEMLRGAPALVLKVVAPGILHKTDVGGVVLGVTDPAAAVAVYSDFSERFPSLTGVLVQQQAEAGTELLVGALQDPGAGPVIVVAAGGVEAELLGDRAIHTAPLSLDAAREVLLSLRTAARLTGFRGSPARDVAAAATAVCRIAQLVAVVPELLEFEVNPLIVSASGATVVDVRVRAQIDDADVQPLRGA